MKRFKLGLQLYTVRDEMEKDVEATLKKISELGYDCVEFAGYFDYSADDLKQLCKKYNLEAIAVHQPYNSMLNELEKATEYLKELGVKYCAIPWLDANLLKSDYANTVEKIRNIGIYLSKNNIQLMYHNHDFEFSAKQNGKYILDALYSDIPSNILIPELDVCWVSYAGCDPVEYIKKYKDIMKILHLKDFECKNLAAGPVYELISSTVKPDEKKSVGFEFRPIGSGRQDMKAIIKAAEDSEIQYLIVEQDRHESGNTSLEDAKISIDYLHSIGY